ncbi:MAG: HD domain-containing protein [Bacteroidales bacterium]
MSEEFTSGHNKRKIINDPVYGFISVPSDLVYDLIEHPYFQRLRRIRQLGLTFYVYPAANHTRFQHALGAVHLMSSALDVIERKGSSLSDDERLGAIAAILLHDIGHGPFSHALENSIVEKLDHEKLSILYMQALNQRFSGSLDTAIRIFRKEYPRFFLHQLVSSQLDMDRLDYLNRDSFFTGVTEGVVGSERIIKMLRVVDDQLVVDRKGIYSIEKYLISRRLMYWQVYLHKTVVAAEQMLVHALKRARELTWNGDKLFVTPALGEFLFPGKLSDNPLADPDRLLECYSRLDDNDIFTALKVWSDHPDRVLSLLSSGLLNRKLLAIRVSKTPFDPNRLESMRMSLVREHRFTAEEAAYLVFADRVSNSAYTGDDEQIFFYDNSGQLLSLTETSDIVNVPLLSTSDSKYFICYPKWLFSSGSDNNL